MTRYTWPSPGQDESNITGSRVADQVRARVGSQLDGYNHETAKDAALAELLSTTPRVLNVRAYGAAGDGVTDDTAAIQAALTDAKSANTGLVVVDFGAGTFLISDDILDGTGGMKLRGEGSARTIIRATAANPMLSADGGDGGYTELQIEGIRFDGDDLATRGIRLRKVNLSYIRDVEVRDVDGIGLDLEGIQDVDFHRVSVIRSGKFSTQLAGIRIQDDTTGDTNSVSFNQCKFERNKWHTAYMTNPSAVRFISCKFHGRVAGVDDVTPAALDLIHMSGPCVRLVVMGCQFAEIRRNAIYAEQDTTAPQGVIIGNSFADPINYQGGAAWNIWLEDGQWVIDGNHFFLGSHTTYVDDGGDINVASTVTRVHGANLHATSAATKVAYAANEQNETPHIGPVLLTNYAAGGRCLTVQVAGDADYRFEQTADGDMAWGDGTNAADVTLGRSAAGVLSLGNGDGLGVGNSAANTNTPSGATAYEIPIYDHSGSLLGYVPVYGSQW